MADDIHGKLSALQEQARTVAFGSLINLIDEWKYIKGAIDAWENLITEFVGEYTFSLEEKNRSEKGCKKLVKKTDNQSRYVVGKLAAALVNFECGAKLALTLASLLLMAVSSPQDSCDLKSIHIVVDNVTKKFNEALEESEHPLSKHIDKQMGELKAKPKKFCIVSNVYLRQSEVTNTSYGGEIALDLEDHPDRNRIQFFGCRLITVLKKCFTYFEHVC